MSILLLIAAPLMILAAAASQPGELKTYGDWIVGCDNGLRCKAVSLFAEDNYEEGPETAAMLEVTREPGARAAPRLAIEPRNVRAASYQLFVDGISLGPLRVPPSAQTVALPPAMATSALAAMVKGSRFELRTAQGDTIARISLKGTAAALRYLDDRQGRAGGASAIVARGNLATNPPVPRLPVIAVPMSRATAAYTPNRAEIARLRRESGCSDVDNGPVSQDFFPLDATHTLILLSCGAGAYNLSTIAYVANAAARRSIRRAAFDAEVGYSDGGVPQLLVNADYDPARRALVTYSKGRGLGDCGTSETLVWDDTRFRLTELSVMGECRGSINWITTFRAEVRRR